MDDVHVLGLNRLAVLLFVLERFQLGLQLIEESHVVELCLVFLLVRSERRSLVGIVGKRRHGQCLVGPA